MRQADDGSDSMKLAILILSALPAFATVDGVVTNRTTGKPQGGATVTLYKLGQAGMESVESVKSAAGGNFTINQPVQGPHLIQTAFDGVTYNHMLPPGRPATGVQLDVYNASKKPGDAKVAQHIVLFETNGSDLMVSENVVYANEGNTTYNDPSAGTLKFFVPPGLKSKVRVMCTAPQGMPIERAAEPAREKGVYKVDFPIKPGETRFQINYSLPMPDPPVFAGKLLHKEGRTRLVTPKGVNLTGEHLESLGQEPSTQANIWELKAATEYKVQIEGSGSLSAPAAPQSDEEDSGPSIRQIMPRVYDRVYLILGLSFGVLALGFGALYRAGKSRA
jgi:hypothetical protein